MSVEYINNGRTKVREVSDAALPSHETLYNECLKSGNAGRTGKGTNQYSLNDSQKVVLNQYADVNNDPYDGGPMDTMDGYAYGVDNPKPGKDSDSTPGY